MFVNGRGGAWTRRPPPFPTSVGHSHAPVPQLWSRDPGSHLPGARALGLQARSAWAAAGWASSGTPGEVWKVWSWKPQLSSGPLATWTREGSMSSSRQAPFPSFPSCRVSLHGFQPPSPPPFVGLRQTAGRFSTAKARNHPPPK